MKPFATGKERVNMNNFVAQKLMDCIGEIDDFFLTEAETADVATIKTAKRKRIVKYSIAGLAVSVGLAMAYWKFKPGKVAKVA